MKPGFNSMSKAELKAYVLAQRNDNEAFYTLVDCYKADSEDQVWHPCPRTPEEWGKVPQLIQDRIEKLDK